MSSAVEISGSSAVNPTFNFDESFCKEILQSAFEDETVRILEIQCTPQTNLLSDTFRLSIRWSSDGDDARGKNLFLFVKTEPSSEIVATEIVRPQGLFATELNVLRKVLPRMERLVQRQLAPKFLYGLEEPKIIAMEDLSKRNFVMKDRQKGLSFSHCLLAIEQLARFHAASVAIHEKDPELVRSFRGGIVSADCPRSFVRLIEVSLVNISRTIRAWPGKSWARLADKLNKLSTTIGQQLTSTYDYTADEFCVLNHGDFWTNNILFQETARGEPIDALMLDYQMSVYTSPAIDLLYFLNICPEIPLKCVRDDFFLSSYLSMLTRTMESFGCKTKPPTMDQLKIAMHERRVYAIMSGVVLSPRMMADAEDIEQFDVILRDLKGETKMDVFKNPEAAETLRRTLPVMDERGYFD